MAETTSDQRIARAREALGQVLDPEVGVNIVDLGLVYAIEALPGGLRVAMTMTSPGCPLASYLAEEARRVLEAALPEGDAVEVALVWDPPWSPERMSEAARRQLGADAEETGSGWFSV